MRLLFINVNTVFYFIFALLQIWASGATKVAPDAHKVAPDSTIGCDFRFDVVAPKSPQLILLGATCRTQ